MPQNIHRAVNAALILEENRDKVIEFVKKLFPESQELFYIGPMTHNSLCFVTMMPEGSGEGREAFNNAKYVRNKFCQLLDELRADWVEVTFGDVDPYAITRMDKEQTEVESYI